MQSRTTQSRLFSIALVLFLFIMLINVVLNIVLKGGSRNE